MGHVEPSEYLTVMNTIQSTNSVTHLFYNGVQDIAGDEYISLSPLVLQAFADISIEAIYVLDFLKRGFHFVANRDFFLCGHNMEEAVLLGYDFYPRVVYGKDLELFQDMHIAILQRLHNMDRPDKVNYFSFAVRKKNAARYLMVYHKLKPIFAEDKLRFGLCLLSSSVLKKPGHLRTHYYNGMDFDEYSFADKQWRKKTIQQLTKREKEVLIWAKQGKVNKEIADFIGVEHQTVRNIQNSIYQKLGVNSMVEAISLANSLHLIYVPNQHPISPKQEAIPASKKQRKPMTPKKCQLVQAELDRGHSINSIATRVDVEEWTIRYHMEVGNLTKVKNGKFVENPKLIRE